MSDLLRILQIGKNAINAHQNRMNVIGNNIANVNTEGFSRRRITLQPGIPHIQLKNIFGSGVDVESVARVRDRFIDQQLLGQRPSLGEFEYLSDSMKFIESILNEPSESGISNSLENFFNAFQDLADDPENPATRQVIKQRATTLAAGLNRLSTQLTQYQDSLNRELTGKVTEINAYIDQVAELNQRIASLENGAAEASDLRDQRDLVLGKLAELVDIKTSENTDGLVSIAVGGKPVLIEREVRHLAMSSVSTGNFGPAVTLKGSQQAVEVAGGSLKGLLETRDKLIPEYQGRLDELARNLATEVNAIHSTGYTLSGETNINFFADSITGAADFAVAESILNDPSRIVASADPNAPGDNSVALALSDLRNARIMNNGDATFGDFYNSFVTSVGSQTLEAERLKDGFELTVQQLEVRKESVSGVSLDEEMVEMIEAQNAFNAAARFITAVDEVTQSVLNML